jgi:hypothetical protein
LAKRTQFHKKSSERNLLIKNELWQYGHLVKWEKRTQNEPKRTQNEPKFKKAKMNVTSIITVDYENISNWAICENEPKTKPISKAKSQSQKHV